MTSPAPRRRKVEVPAPRVELMTITAETAKMMLANNHGNRNVTMTKVALWVAAMVAGDWTLSWDMIAIASNGNLLNGQHRLMAVVQSGISIEAFVMFNAPEEIQHTGDRSKPRSFAQSLQMRGEVNTNNLQAATFFCMHYEDGTLPSNESYSTPEALRWFEANSDIREFIRSAAAWSKGIPELSMSRVLALAYLFSTKSDPDEIAGFFLRLSTGAGEPDQPDGTGRTLPASSPIHKLRRALEKADENKNVKYEQNTLAAWVIKCWNQYLLGNVGPAHYRWSSTGKGAESYPEILPKQA